MNAEVPHIGVRIRQQRVVRSVTQRDLCEAVGITENFLSLIENGRRLPSFETLSRIAAYLDMEAASIGFSEPVRIELKRLLGEVGISEVRRGLEALQRELEQAIDCR
jgi:transcriptional regulator with XRE-family HTH domain